MRLTLLLLSALLSGCTLNKQSTRPEDQEAKEQMARQVLQDSSPRNLNQHPKVVDEFKKSINFGVGGNRVKESEYKEPQATYSEEKP